MNLGCDLCPIRDSVEVPYRGNLQAEILIVGESPGGQEIKNRQPFIGPSGQLLMEQLDWAGIDPASVFYTNAARCLVDRDNIPSRDVKLILELCRSKLELAIEEIKPKAIILCGAIALEQVMRLKGIKGKRGNWLWSNEFNCHVMPTWHPAYILRNQTELENFRTDLQKVARLQKDHWEFDDKGEIIYREVDTIIPLLRGGFMRENGSQFPIHGHRVIRTDTPPGNGSFVTAIDTETQGVNWWDPNSILISYSVAVNLKEAWVVYLHEEVDPESGIEPDFTINVTRGGTKKKPNIVEIGIRKVPGFDRKVEELRELCARNDIKKYFANLKFEKHRLYNLGITELNNAPMDVMIAAHTLDSERFLNNTLSQLVDSFTNLSVNLKGSLTDDEKSDMLLAVRQKRDIVNRYGCFDACATLNVAMSLRKEMAKDEPSLNYYINFVHPTECNLLFELERNGILVDTEKLPQVKKLIVDVMEEKVQEFKKLCSKPVVQIHKNDFKLSRRAILMDALFDYISTDPNGEEMVHNFGFHLRPLKISPKTKLPVCDKDVLTQLLDSPRTPDRAKDLILAYREWSDHNTLLTRYIKNIEETLAPDGRLHPSYSIKFTSSGRTGARNPSIQNFPKRGKTASLIRMLIIAPKGKVLMEVDHSMSELRWVAHVANERKMKEIFSRNGDIHLTTGREVADLQDEAKFLSLSKDQIKQIRQRAKCFHPEVEVLTPKGWVQLKHLEKDELIYQATVVNGEISLELVEPTQLEIRKNHCDTLVHLKNEGIDLRVTPDHRMLGCREGGKPVVLSPRDFVNTRRWWNAGFVVADSKAENEILLRLAVATQADGSFIGSKIRFGFTKQRKIDRMISLLDGVPHKTGVWANGVTWFTITKEYTDKIKDILDSDKTFSWNILSLPIISRLVVLDEIKHWDSCVRNNWRFVRYSSKIRKNVDIIQALASITGNKTRIVEDADGTFNLSIKTKSTSRGGNVSVTEFSYNNDVAVLSVPSTFVLVRDGGVPVITGQSINFGFVYGMSAAGFKNYARVSYHMKITDQEAQKYRVKYFNLYRDLPLWHKDCDDQIRSQGFIRTLFGRKRILPNVFSPDRAAAAEAVRIGTNVIIQGPSSDATLMGGNNVVSHPEFNPNEASINIFIHDALIFEIDEDKVDKYAKIIRYGMENIDTKTYGFNLTVPLLVEAEFGKNLSEMTKYNF